MTLHAVQCHLDNQGSSDLIVDLVIKSASSQRIFTEVSLCCSLDYSHSKNTFKNNIDYRNCCQGENERN